MSTQKGWLGEEGRSAGIQPFDLQKLGERRIRVKLDITGLRRHWHIRQERWSRGLPSEEDRG
jgi:hypothetical protein